MKLLVIILVLLAGCDAFTAGSANCDDELSDARFKHGGPEEINTYTSRGFNSIDYWWWSKGLNMSFSWGSNVAGCDVTVYTFPPIR